MNLPQSQLGALICLLPVEWLFVERLLIIGANSNNFIFMPILSKLIQFYKMVEGYKTMDEYTE